MIDLTFRVIRFPASGEYIAVAWNYESSPPVLFSTPARPSYTECRRMLDEYVADTREPGGTPIALRWFDGFYEYAANSGQIVPASDPSAGLPGEHPDNARA